MKSVIQEATKHQREEVSTEVTKKRALQERLNQTQSQMNNLITVLAETGKTDKTKSIVDHLGELQERENQITREMESIEARVGQLNRRIVNADVIAENLKVFGQVYANLTQQEKFDLFHLVIKKIEYYLDRRVDKDGNMKGSIKMDLWDFPPVDSTHLESQTKFAESTNWRRGWD